MALNHLLRELLRWKPVFEAAVAWAEQPGSVEEAAIGYHCQLLTGPRAIVNASILHCDRLAGMSPTGRDGATSPSQQQGHPRIEPTSDPPRALGLLCSTCLSIMLLKQLFREGEINPGWGACRGSPQGEGHWTLPVALGLEAPSAAARSVGLGCSLGLCGCEAPVRRQARSALVQSRLGAWDRAASRRLRSAQTPKLTVLGQGHGQVGGPWAQLCSCAWR